MTEFAKYISDNNTVFKYARGKSCEDGKEFHYYHEIVYFLDGKAKFISEDISVRLQPDTLIIIPREQYHQFVFDEDDSYLRCIINFFETDFLSPIIGSNLSRITLMPIPPQIKFIFEGLIKLCNTNKSDPFKITVLHSSLGLLLFSLGDTPKTEISGNEFHPVTKQSLDIISKHLKENLSLGDIAKQLNVSVSTLSHLFKNDVKIPIYKFIQEKRLIGAAGLIASGIPATAAAAEYGFKDYSGFFRQYKALFGYAPSKNTPFILV